MGHFNPSSYDFSSDYARSIRTAREDLEKDYPDARVFVAYRDGAKTASEFAEVRLAPPAGHNEVVRGGFQIPRHLFGTTYGYEYRVFSEGVIDYGGIVKDTWLARSDGCDTTDGPARGTRRFTWHRKGGGTAFRTVTAVDASNWMRGVDDGLGLYLSQLTLPGTHNTHARVGTIKLPHDGASTQMGHAVDDIVNFVAKVSAIAECQDLDVRAQLDRGVRYVDFRYGFGLRMRHGQVELPGTLPECLGAVSSWLNDHPSEAVVVQAKWDVWEFITNKAVAEPDDVRAAANQAFADLPRFLDASQTPRLADCRGRFVRHRSGDHGLPQPGRPPRPDWDAPAFTWPPRQSVVGLSPREDAWMEQLHKLNGHWATVEAALAWVKHVRPVANVPQAWDNTQLNGFYVDAVSIASGLTLFPVDFARHGNKALLAWLQRECALAQRYELGVVQIDFAGIEPDLLPRLILLNFA